MAAAAFAAVASLTSTADAALSFTVDPNGWPNATHRQAAVDAAQSAVNRYNAYGDFGNHNAWIYYNAGIPTAQASYLGSIGFGGTYPNERVTMHEFAHYLGSGTYGDPWNGPRGEAIVDQFDGLEASLEGDSAHYWPYGLNFDSEGSEINKQRHVALLYAQRADMGIGSTANPWTATAVNLTASDAPGTSGFNYAGTWSDNRFAHPGAAYTTGNFTLRTPASGNSFTFVGESLRVNNTNGINGGLLYKGTGTTGVTRFKNLIVDGGYIRHANGSGDHFRLDGKVTIASSATIDAAQGPITISAGIGGSGSLTKVGGYPLVLSGGNTYGGSTNVNAGVLRLAATTPVADYTFDNVSGSAVINGGTGGAGMNGTLANGAAIVAGGRFGSAVSLANGASVDINSPIADLGTNAGWTVSAWVKTATAGASILTKGDGAGWSSGNTIFYLGDGTAGGSGGIPSAVRWGGGFFQGSTAAASVADNAWHQVTYVNNGGEYAIYVDGVAQPLSGGNSGFGNADIGAIVRLGVSTNTFAGDGTVNFNGLLDGVQFYNQALSGAQVAALFQGLSVGPLPVTTNVSIAAGATLDVNGITQQVASLTGPSGAAVMLGAGRLTVDSATSTQFAGTISGAGGSLDKAGTGTLTLTGGNTYTGATIVRGGRLKLERSLTSSASVSVTDGTLELADGGGGSRVLRAAAVSITAGGKIDLKDNKLITGTPAGGASGGVYLEGTVQRMVQTAYADGSWSGNGLTTSMPDAATGLTTIAVATAAQIGVATFAGQSVAPSSTIAFYTYGGDTNFDGKLDADDYGTIDFSVLLDGPVDGYCNGDFNYDGVVNADDYGVIDFNILAQGDPFPTGGTAAASLAAVTAVPEPVGGVFASLAAAAILTRRSRRARAK